MYMDREEEDLPGSRRSRLKIPLARLRSQHWDSCDSKYSTVHLQLVITGKYTDADMNAA